ncbi:alanine racemase [Oxalobacteraceae bacterium OM1]|nr:alanine racemase [Oxalobacteraceae bacterium OM1]
MYSHGIHAGAILTIDLGAIRDNYLALRERVGAAACAAVLKADAYGLGAAQVAPVLAAAGCRDFFVAHLDEALALRPLLQDADIYVLHGPMPDTEREFVEHNLIPVLNSPAQLAGWRAAAQRAKRRLPAIVQIDSGMSRLGLTPAEFTAWIEEATATQRIELRYLMSHLACAEKQDHPLNCQQLDAFNAARARLPGCRATFANSSGTFLGEAYRFDLVRLGAALYGITPVAGQANPMKPVVRLQARVLQTRTIERGDHVGYGATYCALGHRRLATLAVGYADGWMRSFSNRGCAMLDGVRLPVVGIVSMDTCTIDISALPADRLQPGDCVDLISAEQPVDAVAALAGTIGYEILTSLGNRYQRNYLGAPAEEPVRLSQAA